MIDKNKLNEYEKKLISSLDKIEEHIKVILKDKAYLCKESVSSNLDEEFKIRLYKNIPLSIHFGIHCLFSLNQGNYEINLKFDGRTINIQRFELIYDEINEHYDMNDLILHTINHIEIYLDDLLS